MDPDQIFIATLGDLEQRIAAPDEYTVLTSALPLRKLLLDATPLMHLVNRNYQLSITFRINDESPLERVILEDGPWFWSLADGLDPASNNPPGAQAPVEVKLDRLLARRVLRVNGHDVTVHDLIDQLAHIEGAVHVGEPKTDLAKVLHELSRQIYVNGIPACVNQARS